MAQSDIEHPGWRLAIWRRKPARLRAPSFVLAPYRPLTRSRFKRALGVSALMFFCLIYGFFFSVFVPSNFAFLVSPLIVLALLVIWALPEVNWAPTRALEWFFYASFISLIVWPNYVAIALPGLPWITMIRLTAFPMALILLICISMSADFRSKLAQSLHALPAVPILLAIFSFIQFYSIGLSKDVSGSIQKFIVAQTTWTAMFFVAVYVFRHPGQIRRWSIALWAMGIFVSLIAIWEFHLGRLPWLGHIPGFLKVDGDAVASILVPHMRAGTTRYRAEATFSTPLGLGEYLALTLPFVLHFTTRRFPQKIRLSAAASIPLMLYGNYLSDAKLGMIGSLCGIVLYTFIAAFQNWKRNKSSLVAASALFGYPVGIGVLATAMMFSHRLSVMILGNDGSHANSTNARVEQYTMGLQKLLAWPFGYGIGQGAPTLGFGADINGMITIDTYYLSIVLEYGVVGFIVYYGMFAIAIFEGVRRSILLQSDNEDRSFLLPISVSLISFIVIKSVFSQQDNHPIVFMMLGALVALAASYKKAPAKAKSKKKSTSHHKTSVSWQVAETSGRHARG